MTWEERYDQTRTVGVDSRDPRATGPPCFGNHEPAAPYRGSVSGANGHASWTGCEKCKLRLSYTPAYGATGTHRAPGPLPVDTKKVVEKLGPAAPYNKELKDPAIGLEGAEQSLLSRLEVIQARKKAAGYSTTSTVTPQEHSGNTTPSPASPTGADPEHLPGHASRKTRKADESAEQLEDHWSQISPGSPASPSSEAQPSPASM